MVSLIRVNTERRWAFLPPFFCKESFNVENVSFISNFVVRGVLWLSEGQTTATSTRASTARIPDLPYN